MKSRHCNKNLTGFTLIEISIVMVIIGLIIGSILVGRDLIRAAEIRSVASDKEKIVTAVNTFRNKYNCMPGACPNATDFFGANPAGCPIPPGSQPSTQTCNGGSTGRIGYSSDYEPYYFWQQLAAAGLWPGIYRGTASAVMNPKLNPTILPPITGNPSNYW
jgi:prepilin-type N-terminal cleavage/methylation domain-containing protein